MWPARAGAGPGMLSVLFLYGDVKVDSGFPVAPLVKSLPAMQEISIRFLGEEDPLEKGEATHSSIPGLPCWLRQ